MLRRKAQRRDAPRELKQLVQRIREKEQEYRVSSRANREYRRAHADVIKRSEAWRTQRWRLMIAIRRLKRELSMYAFPGYLG